MDFTNISKCILNLLQNMKILCPVRKLRHKDDGWLAQDQAGWEGQHIHNAQAPSSVYFFRAGNGEICIHGGRTLVFIIFDFDNLLPILHKHWSRTLTAFTLSYCSWICSVGLLKIPRVLLKCRVSSSLSWHTTQAPVMYFRPMTNSSLSSGIYIAII